MARPTTSRDSQYHQHANSLGLPVERLPKTYYIGQGNETAIIQTDVDFKDAVFVIDDSEIDVNSRGRWIFSIRASKPDYKVPELKTLKRNQENIGLTFETPVLLTVTNSKVKSTSGMAQTKTKVPRKPISSWWTRKAMWI